MRYKCSRAIVNKPSVFLIQQGTINSCEWQRIDGGIGYKVKIKHDGDSQDCILQLFNARKNVILAQQILHQNRDEIEIIIQNRPGDIDFIIRQIKEIR